ncbi:hypothetical protein RhiirA4_466413 [Rhizophagus irregularis]|uniref:Uncharacterized protein n=1 Tax=Rhizophagus irregularis TaxID=588596 RepID=A0A2I1GTY9_9GLOM|nr:hypothetical protein RhiirA4_466413 [Rhizophagus irregularis]
MSKNDIYLAVIKTKYHYKENRIECSETSVLKYLKRHDETVPSSYFIDYSNWKFNEKFYHFISIKENVDLKLLNQLLSGLYKINIIILKLYFILLITKIELFLG